MARLSIPALRRPAWWFRGQVHPGFLAVALLMLALQAGGATVADALRYERAAIVSGEVWRLISGHFIHFNWAHCLLNVGGLVVLAVALPGSIRAWRCCLWLATWIGFALFLALPGLEHYAGFSGIEYGLVVVAWLPRIRDEPIAAVVLFALLVRACCQWLGTGNADAAAWLGAPPLAAAHLAGLVAGVLLLCIERVTPA